MAVYVVQQQMRKGESGRLEPRFSHEDARRFGEIRFLLSPSIKPFRPEAAIRELRDSLDRFTEDDYLLLVGNPCLIGWATAIAAERTGGRVRMLQWSRSGYVEVDSDLGAAA